MAVSLYDIMRPIALFGGLGGAVSVATASGAGALACASTIVGALVAGSAAFWLSQVLVGRIVGASEAVLWIFYAVVFLTITLAAYWGGVGLLCVTHSI